jgi:hypothetical protein
VEENGMKENIILNKKFWEELFTYFLLILHGPHGKLNNWGGGGHTHTENKMISLVS